MMTKTINFRPELRIYMKAAGHLGSRSNWSEYATYPDETRTIANGHLIRHADGWAVDEAEWTIIGQVVKTRFRRDIRFNQHHGLVEGGLVVGECRPGILVLRNNRLWCVQRNGISVFNAKSGDYDLVQAKWRFTPEDK